MTPSLASLRPRGFSEWPLLLAQYFATPEVAQRVASEFRQSHLGQGVVVRIFKRGVRAGGTKGNVYAVVARQRPKPE